MWRFCCGWGSASRPEVSHTHLVPKGHGLVRVLRCDVRHNILQERGLLRFGEETERPRPLFLSPPRKSHVTPKHVRPRARAHTDPRPRRRVGPFSLLLYFRHFTLNRHRRGQSSSAACSLALRARLFHRARAAPRVGQRAHRISEALPEDTVIVDAIMRRLLRVANWCSINATLRARHAVVVPVTAQRRRYRLSRRISDHFQ